MNNRLFINKAKELGLIVHPNRNDHLDFKKLTCGSDKIVHLLCGNKNHDWKASAYDLTRSDNRQIKECTLCKNGLVEHHPWIKNIWDYKKNSNSPNNYTQGSSVKKFFKCPICSKSYPSIISNIIKKGQNGKCKGCANLKVTTKNSFANTKNKLLLKEFDKIKNKLTPNNYTEYSTKKVSWKCSICGNEWDTTIKKRQDGNGCPKCKKIVSKAEVIVLNQLNTIFNNVEKLNAKVNKFKYEFEIDVFVEEYKFGIEIDGRFHSTRKIQDQKKNKYYEEKGIKIFRLRDKNIGFKINENYDIEFDQRNMSKKVFDKLLSTIMKYITVDEQVKENIFNYKKLNNFILFNKLLMDIQHFKTYIPNNLEKERPDLLQYWDFDKNLLPPSSYSVNSNSKVWWLCEKGHSYEQIINKKTIRNYGCGHCSKSITPGLNSIIDLYPNIQNYLKDKESINLYKYGATSSNQVEWINGKHSIRSFIKNFYSNLII